MEVVNATKKTLEWSDDTILFFLFLLESEIESLAMSKVYAVYGRFGLWTEYANPDFWIVLLKECWKTIIGICIIYAESELDVEEEDNVCSDNVDSQGVLEFFQTAAEQLYTDRAVLFDIAIATFLCSFIITYTRGVSQDADTVGDINQIDFENINIALSIKQTNF